MKSSEIALKRRGYINNIDLNQYNKMSIDELYKLGNSKHAFERTISIKFLSKKLDIHNEYFIDYLLEKLAQEKALYTKLEICKVLENGNENTCKILINYLGKIGNNQYKALPDSVSKKISYPLPHDIIARILGRMSKNYINIIMGILENDDILKIYEAIDAIGYMIFYNQELSNFENFKTIKKLLEKYKNNDIIVWKIVICLSAFNLEESKEYLKTLKNKYQNKTILLEIERSLKIVNSLTISN